jgi:hypothetical protein
VKLGQVPTSFLETRVWLLVRLREESLREAGRYRFALQLFFSLVQGIEGLVLLLQSGEVVADRVV